jgi:predicted homoserine dehydrogenase-like protein
MDQVIQQAISKRQKPVDVIVVGLGFMGLGFISGVTHIEGMRIVLIISRRPQDAIKQLKKKGLKGKLVSTTKEIEKNTNKGIISVSDNLDLIHEASADAVLEVTGTVSYGVEASLAALKGKKHLITMNPELQATVGTELKKLADEAGVVISDVAGDQPGSLSNLIARAKLMGFNILVAGNMKRFLNRYATQGEMAAWAKDKGLAVRQTTSFTDGTKQSIEMNLVANYFGLDLLKTGMEGPQVDEVHGAIIAFDLEKIPTGGVVDYVIGRTLFPGVFLVATHPDPNQKQYLRYLGLGEGPYYVLFEPYHLCHLEVPSTIFKAVLFNLETINNGLKPVVRTASFAKRDLKKGETLDGIGGDLVYGNIEKYEKAFDLLPVGLSEGAVLKKSIKKDQTIKLSDVILPENAATSLLGLVKGKKRISVDTSVYSPLVK